jgi:hypothetical protein
MEACLRGDRYDSLKKMAEPYCGAHAAIEFYTIRGWLLGELFEVDYNLATEASRSSSKPLLRVDVS